MATPADSRRFIHKGRIVYALQYRLDDGASVIVWLDRDGNSISQAQPEDMGRRMVTVKPGEWIVSMGERRQVLTVEVWASLPQVVEQPQVSEAAPARV